MDDMLAQEYAEEIGAMVASLTEEREAVALEISVLQSIYGENAVLPFHPSPGASPPHINGLRDAGPSETVRYVVVLNLPDHDEEASIRVLVSLPPSYPAASAPQFQLLSKWIGNFGVDAGLFGEVIRTFYSSATGVEWSADSVCVFDGLQNVLERCAAWYEGKLNQEKVGELLREGEHASAANDAPRAHDVGEIEEQVRSARVASDEARLPDGIQLTIADPIVDRKSIFIGRACRITSPDELLLGGRV
ncbi:hypothetical protein CONPUDRAFT_168829 [Coniophora puteana RWD-64-598 SS2]|uniref:RWD domain-containing protein n=1 Tax=Coniophora puteana (strain RWD-64-598) TaxID=741705 RepID=A0A5M3MAG7_CONPW|nr:uncharacterized protein CONPUDRAFT_168829 [Coniophora puteana RWD-64-598 SS2]EIW76258.1 hypothetical protein CONPUDRAFT_168829 [Coniophora puteana RWD-64-598 SS2]